MKGKANLISTKIYQSCEVSELKEKVKFVKLLVHNLITLNHSDVPCRREGACFCGTFNCYNMCKLSQKLPVWGLSNA